MATGDAAATTTAATGETSSVGAAHCSNPVGEAQLCSSLLTQALLVTLIVNASSAHLPPDKEPYFFCSINSGINIELGGRWAFYFNARQVGSRPVIPGVPAGSRYTPAGSGFFWER